MDLELSPCVEGDRWFPWNYGRKSKSRRVGTARFAPQPGLVVLNAVEADRRVLGSCALRLGYRHSEYVLGDEEYQYGAASAGPAYFWPDDEACPWILIVKSFWVRPSHRRLGIARAFAEYARGLGLPGYLGFANENMKAFFNREFRPTRKNSPLQKKIARALKAPAQDFDPTGDGHFTVFVQAEALAMHLWRSWHGGLGENVDLEQVLCFPDRADFWEIDSGEGYEVGYSDSAFAADRCFGYALSPWLDTWGPRMDRTTRCPKLHPMRSGTPRPPPLGRNRHTPQARSRVGCSILTPCSPTRRSATSFGRCDGENSRPLTKPLKSCSSQT